MPDTLADTLSTLKAGVPLLDPLGMPDWLEEVILSLAIVIAALIVSSIVIFILNIIRKHIAARTETDLDDLIIDALRKPLHLIMIFVGVLIAAKRLNGKFPQINDWVFNTTDAVIWAIIIIVITLFLLKIIKVVSNWYNRPEARTDEESSIADLMPLLSRILKMVVVILALLIILDHFNVDIKGMVAILGVGSLAIALAAQDTVANTIAGFILMIDRPFRKGDRIILPDGGFGDVYSIGLRSTKFLTRENTLVIVPNNGLVKSVITNVTDPYDEIRLKIVVGGAYGSNIKQVKDLMIKAALVVPNILHKPVPRVDLMNFGDSSLDFRLLCRIEDIKMQRRTEDALRCAIYDTFNENNVEIPFPQRVVYLQKEN